MERIKVWHTVRANGISAFNDYNAFMHYLNATREKIKTLYPEVEDKDIEINILEGDYEGSIELVFEFRRFETDEEYTTRISLEKIAKENKRYSQLQQLKTILAENPDLKEEFLNCL